MKKTRMVEVVEFYCDVCEAKCMNIHTTFTNSAGVEMHACSGRNLITGKTCRDVLEDRVLATYRVMPQSGLV